jgi:hypothetical protein
MVHRTGENRSVFAVNRKTGPAQFLGKKSKMVTVVEQFTYRFLTVLKTDRFTVL